MELEPSVVAYADVRKTEIDSSHSFLILHLKCTGDKCSVDHRHWSSLVWWFGRNDHRCVVAGGGEKSEVAYEVREFVLAVMVSAGLLPSCTGNWTDGIIISPSLSQQSSCIIRGGLRGIRDKYAPLKELDRSGCCIGVIL
jgi:hypothetical protein